jgi:hypothetical protein
LEKKIGPKTFLFYTSLSFKIIMIIKMPQYQLMSKEFSYRMTLWFYWEPENRFLALVYQTDPRRGKNTSQHG